MPMCVYFNNGSYIYNVLTKVSVSENISQTFRGERMYMGLLASKRAIGHDGVVHVHFDTLLCGDLPMQHISKVRM